MTDKEALKRWPVVVTGFTGILSCGLAEIQADVERLLGRPVMTHELATKITWKEIKEVYRAEFNVLVERGIKEK